MADGRYERIGRTLVRHGVILDEYVDRISLPDGGEEDWDLIDHKGAAAVIPVLPDGRIVMVRQWRNPLERETLEIPAGGLKERGEPTLDAAARELQEETGYTAGSMTRLIRFASTVAFCNEIIDIYLAEDLTPGSQHLDPDEFLNVEAHGVEELLHMIDEGVLQDGKTVAGILAYAHRAGK